MKIAVTAQGTRLDSPVDPRFGRTKHFVVYDTESQEMTSYDNSVNLNATQGAGIQAGRVVVELGVEALLTGHVGPKAFATLNSAGVQIFAGVAGTVQDAIEQFEAGRLVAAEAANVEGHW
jgi:predicted Fe-Mo cluster-binding NifX family protein